MANQTRQGKFGREELAHRRDAIFNKDTAKETEGGWHVNKAMLVQFKM